MDKGELNGMRKRNKLVHGVGVNDANYPVVNYSSTNKITGKPTQTICIFYNTWKAMLERCYSESLKRRRPSYIGCTVCEEWLLFSNFKVWMETQDWKGNQLDKDLLIEHNKVYSPETCLFLSREVNSFLTSR